MTVPRKSAAALSVVTRLSDHRPPPPDDLPADQQAEWRAIVGRMPSGWFPRETHGLLRAYVGHLAAYRTLAKLVDSFDSVWLSREDRLERYGKLLTMRERETRALASLAVRMRLSQSSQLRADKAATAVRTAPHSGLRPWEKHA
jgi:hypothetical protein